MADAMDQADRHVDEWERHVMQANADFSREYRDRLSLGQAFCGAVFVLASAVFVYHAIRFFLG